MSFWISFSQTLNESDFFHYPAPNLQMLKHDEKKSNKFYHLINKYFRFGKEDNNNFSLKY